jgi:hypothetical protein
MQLLKKREFGDFFNDTFAFIRENGKHFYSRYFQIMVLPLALIVVMIFFLTTTFYGLSGFQEDFSAIIEDYFNTHSFLAFTFLFLFVLISLIVGVLQFSFTPVYLILYQERGTDFTARDMLNLIFKKYSGKILLFILTSILIAIPVGIIAIIATLLLLITIIGAIFPIATVSLWFSMWFIDYLSSDKGVMESLGEAWNLLTHRFWAYVGASALFLILAQLALSGISILTGVSSSILTLNTLDSEEKTLASILIMVFSFIITQFLSIVIQTVIYLMQNIIYYTAKEEVYHIAGYEEIEEIGKGE